MRLDEIGQQRCPMAQGLAEIGDAWSLLIIREAFYGRQRFSEFVERTRAQKTVVSARLKQLVEAGVLAREQYSEHPPRHRYVLTEKGRALEPLIVFLSDWGARWVDDGPGIDATLHHDACGKKLQPVMHCAACGDPVEPGSVSARFAHRGSRR